MLYSHSGGDMHTQSDQYSSDIEVARMTPMTALWLAFVSVLPTLVDCSSKYSATNDVVPPEPVAECLAYEDAMKTCLHRDFTIARQPSLIPTNRVQLSQIRSLCSQNLAQMKTVCR
jgi:hypothetical protein